MKDALTDATSVFSFDETSIADMNEILNDTSVSPFSKKPEKSPDQRYKTYQ